MTAPNKEKKLVKQMQQTYEANRALLVESMNECSKGTSSYRQHVADLDRLDRAHRDEMAARGVTPENLGRATKTEYHFVAHTHVLPASRAEAEAIMQKEIKKAIPNLYYSEDDDFVRHTLETMTYEESVSALEQRGIAPEPEPLVDEPVEESDQ